MSPKAEHVTGRNAQAGEAVTATALAGRARTWWIDEPLLLRREQEAMATVAADLTWSDNGAGSWSGLVPAWPFERAEPPGLGMLLAGRRLRAQVSYGHAFPMTAPSVWPIDPEPSIAQRTQHEWHVNGDGSLCLLEAPAAWTGREPATELIIKAAGWFIEYLLMSAGLITGMTSTGLAADLSMDAVITRAGMGCNQPAQAGTAPDAHDQSRAASPAAGAQTAPDRAGRMP